MTSSKLTISPMTPHTAHMPRENPSLADTVRLNTSSFQPTQPSDWQSFPKISLHEHIDGGLRPSTLLELSKQLGLSLPFDQALELGRWMQTSAETGNLLDYLRGFAHTVAAMSAPGACRRVAFELAEDAKNEGCVLAEFRMAPQLLEAHGLSAQEALEGMLEGLAQSNLASGLIVCAMRTDMPDRTLAAAQLAARYAKQGVIGFDLAGAELGFPPHLHSAAIEYAKEAGLGITIHAGEADEGSRVLEAARLGARRIGHGIRIMENHPNQFAWLAQAQDKGLHFEVCPSSNVHTGAVQNMGEHPLKHMLAHGLSCSISVDNRLMSGTSLCQELHTAYTRLGLTVEEIIECQYQAVQASFCSPAQKAHATEQLTQFLLARPQSPSAVHS